MTMQEIIQTALDRFVADIIQASKDAGQEASGDTYRNIVTENVSPSHGEVWAPEYIDTLIRGRGPGKIPENFPEIIMEWAKYKGINFSDPKEFVRWANAVAWGIKRYGSELHRNHLQVDIFNTAYKNLTDYMDEQLSIFYSQEIRNAIMPESSGRGFII